MGSPRPLGAPQISGSPGYGAAPPRPPSPRAALPPPSPRDAHGAFRLPPHTSMGPPHIPPHILPLGRAVERTSAARFLPSVWGFFRGRVERGSTPPHRCGGNALPYGGSWALWGKVVPYGGSGGPWLAVGRRLGEVETKFAWRLLLRGRKCAVGHNGELWGTMRCYGAQWGAVGHNGAPWGTMRSCGAQWGAVGRCGVSPDPAPPRLYGAQLGPIGGITGKFGAGIWDIGLGFGTKV